MLAAALALGASLGWGSADFLGGLKSRALPVLTVLFTSQVASLCLVAATVLIIGAEITSVDFVLYGALSGIAQTIGIGAYYHGLSIGAMGVVAPISATAALVPVSVGLVSGERPTGIELLGMVFAVTGVVLASYQPDRMELHRKVVAAGVGMALLAALGIGSFFAAIDAAADRGDIVSAVLINRVVAVALLTIALMLLGVRLAGLTASDVGAVVTIGVLAVGSTLLFAAATTEGLVSLVAVIAALYPVTTILLARLLLHERVRRPQRLGAAAALIGVGMIAT